MRSFIEEKLQNAINRYLLLDPESKKRMEALENKCFTVHLDNIQLEFQILFSGGYIKLKTENFLSADACLSSTPLSLLHLLLAKDRKTFFKKERVNITGDAELAQTIMELFAALEIDWEHYFSRWFGDVTVYQAARIVKKIKKASHYFNQSLIENINEYLHEEANLSPTRETLEDFFQEIDILRMDVDRLALRIENLQAILEEEQKK